MPTLSSITVFYDQDCPLCRSLAHFMGKKVAGKISFISWQLYQKMQDCPSEHKCLKADTLRVWNGHRLLEGTDAWHFLLEAHPQLAGLNWLSQKMGITENVSTAISWTGKTARRICFKCRR
ncbi:MAG: DUF393 domain-containing protein [Oligoflexales bacterium]|nr:DUF393 domain-containing protein [Oligoflexales bacterium]